jgi:polyhydroxyalkanoate synthesis regulator phasin
LKELVITAVRKHINWQVVPQTNMLYAAKEYALTSFFDSQKSGSKVESSKVQPVDIPGYLPSDSGALPDQPGNVMETFDDYVAWQQKNAHRLIIQFKLLKCDHNRLKKTGWVFDKKRIHRHFTEAYIFKSKDPSGEFINVLPKHPFIFTSPFEFEDQIIVFVNEVIDRLRAYGIAIDLSEPAEIRLEHAALEDNIFARKVIEKGLLYFQSKIQAIDSTGEIMEYVIAIDKSKKLHLEFEGTEAHHLMENCERFIDDVATGKIKGEDIKKMPQKFQDVETQIKKEFKDIEEKLNSSIQGIEDTQILLHQNQLGFSQNQNSLADATQKISGAVKSVSETACSIKETVELLKECFQLFIESAESLNMSHDPFNDNLFSKSLEEGQMNVYEGA